MAKLRHGLEKILSIDEWVIAVEKGNTERGDNFFVVNTSTGEEIFKGQFNDTVAAVQAISAGIGTGTIRVVHGKNTKMYAMLPGRKRQLEKDDNVMDDNSSS